jgi:hypothetical protein
MKYIYLTQTESDIDDHRKNIIISDESELIVLSWKEEVSGNPFLPNSSWNEGRNYLRELALDKYPEADYYIFFDDDISLKLKGVGNAFREFESLLDKHKPMVATPFYNHHIRHGINPNKEFQMLYYFDANFNAFSRKALGEVLPYYKGFDKESWHYSQVIVFQMCKLLYCGHCYQFNNIILDKYIDIKRDYPRSRNLHKADDLIINNLIDKKHANEIVGESTTWYRENTKGELRSFSDIFKTDFKK